MSATDITAAGLTPVEYQVQIAQVAFPHVDVLAVTPTVDDVALLLQTRTLSMGGGAIPTFTTSTRPTAAQVAGIIASSVVLVLSELPAQIPDYVVPQIREAVRYQAAITVERSFFREQVQNGNSNAPEYQQSLDTLKKAIEAAAGTSRGASRRGVHSAVMRSTMTDYDPYYPLPAPRQVLEFEAVDPDADGGSAAAEGDDYDGGNAFTTVFTKTLDGGGA